MILSIWAPKRLVQGVSNFSSPHVCTPPVLMSPISFSPVFNLEELAPEDFEFFEFWCSATDYSFLRSLFRHVFGSFSRVQLLVSRAPLVLRKFLASDFGCLNQESFLIISWQTASFTS